MQACVVLLRATAKATRIPAKADACTSLGRPSTGASPLWLYGNPKCLATLGSSVRQLAEMRGIPHGRAIYGREDRAGRIEDRHRECGLLVLECSLGPPFVGRCDDLGTVRVISNDEALQIGCREIRYESV